MTDFSAGFSSYIPPTPDMIRSAFTEGLVVLDTNVLASAYRFAPQAREELLGVIGRVGDRLWVPHQVRSEFHRNRFNVIAEHAAAYEVILQSLKDHRLACENDIEKRVRELANRAALSDDERDKLIGLVRNSMEPVRTSIEDLHTRHGLGPLNGEDPVLLRLQAIFAGKVGAALDPDEEAVARAEANRRISNRHPPGYRDAGKSDPCGDYLVWFQTLQETKRRSAEFLLFVTDDAKEDWYFRIKGNTVMARTELADEALAVAGAKLIMLPTKAFLSLATRYLQTAVSAETIRQAGWLPESPEVSTIERRLSAALTAYQNAMRRAYAARSDLAAHDALVQDLIARREAAIAAANNFIALGTLTEGSDGQEHANRVVDLQSQIHWYEEQYEVARKTGEKLTSQVHEANDAVRESRQMVKALEEQLVIERGVRSVGHSVNI